MAGSKFSRLVRFKNPRGEVHYGEFEAKAPTWDQLVGTSVSVYKGDSPWDDNFTLSDEKEEIAEVLSPISQYPICYGIRLNYKAHSTEANLPSGPFPIVFTKPPGALAGPFEDIPFNKQCEEMDYEGELSVIIGKDCKNLGENEDPTPYILGYTVGNDVSSRYWQRPERSGNQHGYAKSFDKFAPIGPVLVSTSVIPDPKALTLRTKVNGEQRQITKTDDLIFDIPAIIRHLSRGTTLRPGTLIMTGTPSGVAAFMKPPAWLKDGDVVEIEISEIGKIRNRMVLEN